MPKLDCVLTCDPGKNTAYCYWVKGTINAKGVFKTDEKDNVAMIAELSQDFEDIIKQCRNINKVCIESVGMWSGSAASVISASKGDTFGLAYLVGAYINICLDYGLEVELIDPRKWKGQLNKPQTKLRVTRALGYEIKNEHLNDAVGIGLSLQGRL